MADVAQTNPSGAEAAQAATEDQQVSSSVFQNKSISRLDNCKVIVLFPYFKRINHYLYLSKQGLFFFFFLSRMLFLEWATCHWSVQLVRRCPMPTAAPRKTCPCWREWWMSLRVAPGPWERPLPPGPNPCWTCWNRRVSFCPCQQWYIVYVQPQGKKNMYCQLG